MPSWNEKPVAVPVVNVNLKQCTCDYRISFAEPGTHFAGCPGTPVLLPCPLPRSVTFVVRQGRCICPPPNLEVMRPCSGHVVGCPGVPVRVSYSIGGTTWAESEVMLAERHDTANEANFGPAFDVCRERWALVKALVTGIQPDFDGGAWTGPALPYFQQRNAVFSALTDMARAEQAALDAQERVEKAFPYHRFHRVGDGTHAGPRPTHARLAVYVEFLVEQVGVL